MTNNIHQNILDRIESGDISMRSKSRFVLKFIALIFLAVVVIVVSVTLFSFMLFILRYSGNVALLSFDHRELFIFLTLFPWALLIVDILAIIGFEIVLNKFTFGYRRSVLTILFITLSVTAFAGFVLDEIRANDSILEHARNQHVPFFGSMYEQGHRPPPREIGICRCIIESFKGNVLTMYEDDNSGSTTVVGLLPAGFPVSLITLGQPVFVIGDFASGTIEVVDIRAIQKMR